MALNLILVQRSASSASVECCAMYCHILTLGGAVYILLLQVAASDFMQLALTAISAYFSAFTWSALRHWSTQLPFWVLQEVLQGLKGLML
eukprot:5761943-Amphidinium_carterae.1